MLPIPALYRPKTTTDNGDTDDLALLFHANDDDDDDSGVYEDRTNNNNNSRGATNHSLQQNRPTRIEVTDLVSFWVQQPPDKGALFAHQVWSGSRLLAEYLIGHSELVKGKSTIELGAGTALPSLAALQNGSRISVITDYPDEDMLQAIRETVGYNWSNLGHGDEDTSKSNLHPLEDRVAVVGHEWGSCTELVQEALLLRAAAQLAPVAKTTTNPTPYFDVALLSECLWNHRLHEGLATSLDALLHPTHGLAIVTYAHHIPGLEEQDDAFFTLCAQERFGGGFQILQSSSLQKEMPYMWDSTKTIPVLLKILVRKQKSGCAGG